MFSRFGFGLALCFLALSAVILVQPCSATTAEGEKEAATFIRIAAVGDVMMGTEGMLPADDGVSSFTSCAALIKSADIGFFNLEGTLTDQGKPTKKYVPGRSYIFKTPPHYGVYLEEAGFNMASLANNHINDFGPVGKQVTMATLDKHGIKYSDNTGLVALKEVKGVKVAMAAFFINPAGKHNLNNIPGAVKIVQKLAGENDIVIVSFHGGKEGRDATHVKPGMERYLGENRGDLIKFSHAVIDAGADLVIGHGPHVPRAMETYKGRLIAYSLGNFCTGKGLSVKGVSGYAPLLLVDVAPDGRLLGGKVHSFIQAWAQPPVLDKQNRAAKLIYQLGLEDFPQTTVVGPEGEITAPPQAASAE